MFDLDFQVLALKAHEAGVRAVERATVVPMVVQQRADPINDSSPVVQQYMVPDGVCGFAWVKFKGNTAWGRYAKKNLKARPAYPTGLQINISAYNQSMQKKEAYATAYAAVLREAGVDAWADSRLD